MLTRLLSEKGVTYAMIHLKDLEERIKKQDIEIAEIRELFDKQERGMAQLTETV